MTQQEFFNRYTYNLREDKLGGGSFGKVFKAYDTILNRYVAIKVAEVIEIGNKSLSLQDEIAAVSKLPVHPNIAHYESVYQFQTPHGNFDYAIMQYYPDGSLADVMEKETLSFEQKEQIAQGILKGVAFLHNYKVTHRDLKPANILIVKHQGNYIPKIADFGLSKQAAIDDKSYFENSIQGGTIAYSSPEQLLGKEQLHLNTDIWSVGVVLYNLFTGELPFNAGDMSGSARELTIQQKILQANIPDKINTIPEPYQSMIRQCLIKDPEKRVRRLEALAIDVAPESTTDDATFIIQEDSTRIETLSQISDKPIPKNTNTDAKYKHTSAPVKQSLISKKYLWVAIATTILLLSVGALIWMFASDNNNTTNNTSNVLSVQQAEKLFNRFQQVNIEADILSLEPLFASNIKMFHALRNPSFNTIKDDLYTYHKKWNVKKVVVQDFYSINNNTFHYDILLTIQKRDTGKFYEYSISGKIGFVKEADKWKINSVKDFVTEKIRTYY